MGLCGLSVLKFLDKGGDGGVFESVDVAVKWFLKVKGGRCLQKWK